LLLIKEEASVLKGVRNGCEGPPISHLLFIDDRIFFARCDQKSMLALNETLHLFCHDSRRSIWTNLVLSLELHCHIEVKNGSIYGSSLNTQ
jgi:hypothetical protein